MRNQPIKKNFGNRYRNFDLIADIAVIFAAWYITGLVWGGMPNVENAILDPSQQIIYPMLIIAVGTAFWLQFRLGSKILWLSNPALRRDMALSLTSGRVFLKQQLSGMLIFLQAPAFTTLPFLALLSFQFFNYEETANPSVLWWSVHNMAFAMLIIMLSPATNFIVICGNLSRLISCCTSSPGPLFLFFQGFAWLVFSLMPLIFGSWIFKAVMDYLMTLSGSPAYQLLLKIGLLALGIVFFAFIFFAGYLFRKKWERACQVYYQFEN